MDIRLYNGFMDIILGTQVLIFMDMVQGIYIPYQRKQIG